MSKADRIRRAHAEEIARLQQKKKSRTPGWVYGLIAGVIGAVAAVVIVILALQVSGTTLRNTVSVVGSGDDDRMEIDNAVMCYYYMTNYSQYVNTYSSYLSYLGLDTSDSLKTQEYYGGDGKTWFEYFAEAAEKDVCNYLACCEEARLNGMKLEKEDKEFIKDQLDTLIYNIFNSVIDCHLYTLSHNNNTIKLIVVTEQNISEKISEIEMD